jgi:proteasome lid subunit RPN8/RPN11
LASDPDISVIKLPVALWARLVLDLRRRGRGQGESGAFLLGRARGSVTRVTEYVCYDDLDPNAYQFGGIAFHAAGYAKLWEYCRQKRLQVLADVHTHPGDWTGQSSIDQKNPMVPVTGHTALILPNYAQTPWWSLKAVGVYEYLGNFEWRTHGSGTRRRRVSLSAW